VDPRIDIITLGVADLERALNFYRALGLQSPGIVGTQWAGDETNAAGAVAMFRLPNGTVLSLYPRTELAKDASLKLSQPEWGEFSIGQLVDSRDQVDAVLAQAQAAGATVTDQPHDRPWGIYSGYFRDPDGHLWEIIHHPQADQGASSDGDQGASSGAG
jgi:catechol 2,3-dioxygenase-like lactoylglutathione lyase family enzyme